MTLMEKYLGKGHILYVDNWYSSPKLFETSANSNADACGTVKKNRNGMPSFSERLRRGEQVHKCTEDLLAIKWKDKRDVFIITTVHTADMISTSKIDAKTQRETIKPR